MIGHETLNVFILKLGEAVRFGHAAVIVRMQNFKFRTALSSGEQYGSITG